jgi:phage terminase Nu1 subunit (DNA packaging protein)
MTKINLAEAARIVGVSVPTLRKVLAEERVPTLKDGGKGDAYEFDGEVLVAWWRLRQQRIDAEAERQREELEQLQLSLVGGESASPETMGLSAKERQAFIASELAATNLKRLRGELVDAGEMREALTNAFTQLRTELLRVPLIVAERFNLDRAAEAALTAVIEERLKSCIKTLQGALAPAANDRLAA